MMGECELLLCGSGDEQVVGYRKNVNESVGSVMYKEFITS